MLVLKSLMVAGMVYMLIPMKAFVQGVPLSQETVGTGQVPASQSTLTQKEFDTLANRIDEAHSKALYEEEEKLAREGLERAQHSPKEDMSAHFQSVLGAVFLARGDSNTAYFWFQESLKIRLRIHYKEGIAESYNNVGIALTGLGQFEEALTNLNASLEFIPPADKASIADTVKNIADVYMAWGRYDQALDYYLHSVDLLRDPPAVSQDARQIYAYSLNNLANANAVLGRHAEALHYYQQAATLLKTLPDTATLAVVYTGMGSVYARMEKFQEALAYYQRALPLAQNNPVALAGVQNNIGANYQELKDWEQAAIWLRKSLSNYESVGDKLHIAASLDNLGFIATRQGHYAEALNCLSRALKQKQLLGNPHDTAETYRYLGDLYEQQREWGKSEEAYEKARSLYEGVSRQIWNPAEVGSFQETNQGRLYALYAAMLCKQHKMAQALEIADSGRAQGLARQAAQSRVNLATFTKEDVQRWQQTQTDFFKASRILHDAEQQIEEASTTERRKTQELLKRQQQYGQAQRSLLQEQAVLSHKYPLFQRLAGIAPLTTAQLYQMAVKRPDTLFLHFNFLDREHLLLLTLSHKDGIREYTLSAPTEGKSLSVLIREWQESLAAFGHKTPDMSLLDKKRLDDLAVQEPMRAKMLYKTLLAPLEQSGLLAPGRYKRLVVVPDGALCQVPLAALVMTNEQRLMTSYPVAVTTSLGLLTWPSSPRRASGSLFFVADPAGQNGQRLKNTLHGLALMGDKPIPLPHMRSGSKRVAQMFAGANGLVGSQATKSEVLKHLPNYDLLLLATHGYLMPDNGLLSSLLLAGKQGSYERLEASEILCQPLSARLVGLMACESGAGSASGGEGILGLVWAFCAAGCPSVLASSWSVEDAATEALMVAFYKQLRQEQQKDVALQKAMQAVQSNPRWRHPFFWAAFQVYGNADPIILASIPAMSKRYNPALHHTMSQLK